VPLGPRQSHCTSSRSELDYTPSFTRGHPKAFRLADRIAAHAEALDCIFFVNFRLRGGRDEDRARLSPGARQIFVSRERACHGVNFGGVAPSMMNNRRAFGLPSAVHMRHTRHEANRFVKDEGTAPMPTASRPMAPRACGRVRWQAPLRRYMEPD
jgi:adenosylmethionine-8-amino-7-oxononanoate aminotransferase